MLYQGYVARPLRKELMEDAFIGRRAVALRINRIEAELEDIQKSLQLWKPVFQTLNDFQSHDILCKTRLYSGRQIIFAVSKSPRSWNKSVSKCPIWICSGLMNSEK